jgi:hypothetical protein
MTGRPARSAEDNAEMARLQTQAERTEDWTAATAHGLASDIRACERVAAKLEALGDARAAQLRDMAAWLAE